MSKVLSEVDFLPSSASRSYSEGVKEGLEIAARIADRHSALQGQYAAEAGAAMPNSAHAFTLQKVVARSMAETIREAIGNISVAGRTVVIS